MGGAGGVATLASELLPLDGEAASLLVGVCATGKELPVQQGWGLELRWESFLRMHSAAVKR